VIRNLAVITNLKVNRCRFRVGARNDNGKAARGDGGKAARNDSKEESAMTAEEETAIKNPAFEGGV
jgi:hypothetical protein